MARDLPTAVSTAIVGQVVKLAHFAEFDFVAGFVRVWSGTGTIHWSSHDWTGLGTFGGASPVDETTETGAAGMTFSLSGVPSSMVALALGENYRGRACKLWLAILDEDDAVVNAYQVFGGRMDTMKIDDAGETATLSIMAESRMIDLGRARNSRYTDAEQQRLHPGDLGLQYVAKLAEKPLYWGVPPS